MRQFDTFRASSLYCAPCGQAQPVREKLARVLPDKEIYEYLCASCGSKVGSREVSLVSNLLKEENPAAAPAATL